MQEKVLSLWEGKTAEVFTVENRQKLSNSNDMTRVIHSFGRSQCRTTHKRQDC
jgi:uncharacterized protein YukE